MRWVQALAVKNAGVEQATAWIMDHMGDDDFAAPLAGAAGAAPAADPESVAIIGA